MLPAPCEDLYFDAVITHKSFKMVRVDSICWDNKREKKLAIGRGLYSVVRKDSIVPPAEQA